MLTYQKYISDLTPILALKHTLRFMNFWNQQMPKLLKENPISKINK